MVAEELSSTDHRTSEEALGPAGGRKRTWNRRASATGEACERKLATDRDTLRARGQFSQSRVRDRARRAAQKAVMPQSVYNSVFVFT